MGFIIESYPSLINGDRGMFLNNQFNHITIINAKLCYL